MKTLRLLLALPPLVIIVWFAPGMGTTGDMVVTTTTRLTENHLGRIIIQGGSLTLDCAGHSVIGNGPGHISPVMSDAGIGIQIAGRLLVTVTNCHVTRFDTGIDVAGGTRNTIINNVIEDNTRNGVSVTTSNDNHFIDNMVRNNGRDGFDVDDSQGNTFRINQVTGNICNGIELDRSNSNTFEDNVANNNGTGRPRLCETPEGPERRNGFSLDASSRNTLTRNKAEGNGRDGFRIRESSNSNNFTNNSACNNRRSDGEQDNTSLMNMFFPDVNSQFCRHNIFTRAPGD